MKFSHSQQDKLKWSEFHSPDFVQKQMQVKRMMQADLIKAIDGLSEVTATNAHRIQRLNEAIVNEIALDKRLIYQKV